MQQTFRDPLGKHFPVYEPEDLDLMVDLLAHRGDNLSVLFACASFLGGSSRSVSQIGSNTRRHLETSLHKLLRAGN